GRLSTVPRPDPGATTDRIATGDRFRAVARTVRSGRRSQTTQPRPEGPDRAIAIPRLIPRQWECSGVRPKPTTGIRKPGPAAGAGPSQRNQGGEIGRAHV